MAPYGSFDPHILSSLFDLTVHLLTADGAFPDARLLYDVNIFVFRECLAATLYDLPHLRRDYDFLLLACLTLQHFQRVSFLELTELRLLSDRYH